ncbi:hypothetical protein [Microcoleus sp. B4-D1]|uniref:hypothetical protein n=1 Tax=Microcoleus sp. B4-D1 TaxID=2818666 RepID=UPI002FD1D019
MLLWNGRLARQEQARCLFHKNIQSSCNNVSNRQDACSTKTFNLLAIMSATGKMPVPQKKLMLLWNGRLARS